jgi:hypothetical protein
MVIDLLVRDTGSLILGWFGTAEDGDLVIAGTYWGTKKFGCDVCGDMVNVGVD